MSYSEYEKMKNLEWIRKLGGYKGSALVSVLEEMKQWVPFGYNPSILTAVEKSDAMAMFYEIFGEEFYDIAQRCKEENHWELKRPGMSAYPWYFDYPEAYMFQGVAWNTDCDSEAQFIIQDIPYSLVAEAYIKTSHLEFDEMQERFFDYLDDHAKTRIINLGDPDYLELLNRYTDCKELPLVTKMTRAKHPMEMFSLVNYIRAASKYTPWATRELLHEACSEMCRQVFGTDYEGGETLATRTVLDKTIEVKVDFDDCKLTTYVNGKKDYEECYNDWENLLITGICGMTAKKFLMRDVAYNGKITVRQYPKSDTVRVNITFVEEEE